MSSIILQANGIYSTTNMISGLEQKIATKSSEQCALKPLDLGVVSMLSIDLNVFDTSMVYLILYCILYVLYIYILYVLYIYINLYYNIFIHTQSSPCYFFPGGNFPEVGTYHGFRTHLTREKLQAFGINGINTLTISAFKVWD